MPDQGSCGVTDFLRFPRPALAEHPHVQSHRERIRHDPSPNQAHKGVPVSRRHAPYDVQTGPMRREKLAQTARLRPSRRRHQGRRFRERHQAINPRSSRRMRSAWTPDLTIARLPQRDPLTKRNGHRRLSYLRAPRLRPLLTPPNDGTQIKSKLDLRMALKKGAGHHNKKPLSRCLGGAFWVRGEDLNL